MRGKREEPGVPARREHGLGGGCTARSWVKGAISLCVILSQSLSISYLVLRVLVRACSQEELHGGGATVARGIHESRVAKLYMRGKRME